MTEEAKPKSVELTEMQAKYISDALAERKRIDRDISIAVAMALAGHGIDATESMGYSLDGKTLSYALPSNP
jgi:hypothetical protein